MVDQEGIRFILETEFRGQGDLDRFQAQVREIRRELGQLSRAQRRVNQARDSSTRRNAAEQTARQIRRQNRNLEDQIPIVRTLSRAQRRLAANTALGVALERERLRILRQTLRVLRGVNRETRAQAASQRSLAAAAGRGADAVERQRTAFDRLAGTIRGVVVGLIAYRGLTRGLDLLTGQIRNAVQFGNELQIAENAIAGLVLGAGDLIDSQGQLVADGDRFAASLGIARNELEQIRSQALGTSATFRELVSNFQLNVSQGLNAGLNLDQFREVALLFSQGATLLGVNQNQLAEEIRSVLQGTIRTRDTRIAVALGITNEDIRRAREAGTLFEFIEERFEGIAEAAEALRNSLPIIASDIRDALDFAAVEGARPLRQALTNIGQEFRDSLVTQSAEGRTIVDPQVVDSFRNLFQPLAGASNDIASISGPLSEVLVLFGQLTFEIVELGTTFLVLFQPVIEGVTIALRGLNVVLNAIQFVFRSVAPLFDEFTLGIGRALPALLGIVTVLRTLRFLFIEIGARIAVAIIPAFGKLAASFRAVASASLLVVRRLLLVLTIIEGLAFLARQIPGIGDGLARALNEAFGTSFTPEQIDEFLGAPTEQIFDAAVETVGDAAGALDAALQDVFNTTRQGIVDLDQIKTAEEALARLVNVSQALGAVRLEEAFADLDSTFGERLNLIPQIAGTDGLAREGLQLRLEIEQQLNETLAIGTNQIELRRRALESETLTAADRAQRETEIETIQEDQAKQRELARRILRQELTILEDAAQVEATRTREILRRTNQINRVRASVDAFSPVADRQLRVLDLEEQLVELAERRRSVEEQIATIQATREAAGLFGGARDVDGELVIFPDNVLATLRGELEEIGLLSSQVRNDIGDLLSDPTFGQGAQLAFNQLREQLTDGAIGGRLFGGIFTALRQNTSNALREGLTAAFTGQDIDGGQLVQNLGAQIGIDAAQAFLENVLDQFIFQPILNGLGSIFGLNTSTTIANTAAVTANTVAISTLAGIIGASQVASSVVASAAGALGGGYFGGAVGFDEGGSVGGPSMPSTPAGFHPNDNIPALLRRGEYVATPEMNQRMPGLFGFLEKLRRGVHAVPNFGKLKSPLRGFNTGGSTSGEIAAAGSFSGGGSDVQVLPVLVTDENNLRRIHDNPQFAAGARRRTNRAVFRTLGQARLR